jgi:hypothetical protein
MIRGTHSGETGRSRTLCRAALLTALLSAAILSAGCGGDQATPQSGPGVEKIWNFDEDRVSSPPEDSEVFGGTWKVRPEPGAPTEPNAVCQTEEAESPTLVLGDATYTDFALSASFKPLSGEEPQTAGLVFRFEDEDNHYAVGADAREDTVVIYKHSDGERTQLARASASLQSLGLRRGEWSELRVEVEGSQIRVLVDLKEVVEATDDEFPAGKVGLWTGTGSEACFDRVLTETT